MDATSLRLNLESLTAGNLSVILTRSPEWVKKAQELRHQAFFECASKHADNNNIPPVNGSTDIDEDEFDALCDHLLVINHENEDSPVVVGVYRLRLYDTSSKQDNTPLYTQTEFDISSLMNRNQHLLELGRSCVHPSYRTGAVIQLLWRGIGAYVAHHNVHYLFGCASFSGTNALEHQLPISYLYHYHRAPEEICPQPLPEMCAPMDILPVEAIDEKEAFSLLPPLIKGYIRVGGKIGDGIITDWQCSTTDICVVVDVSMITPRYYNHFVQPQCQPAKTYSQVLV